MKKLLIIFLFVSLICSLTAQTSPDTLWTKTFGGYNEDAAFQLTSPQTEVILLLDIHVLSEQVHLTFG